MDEMVKRTAGGEIDFAKTAKDLLQLLSDPTIWTATPIGIGVVFVLLTIKTAGNTIAHMFGFGSVEFTSAPKTVTLKRKDKNTGGDTTLLELVKSVVPPLRLSPLLFNGHLQTAFVVSNLGPGATVYYKRHIFQNDYKTFPGQYATDWVVPQPAKEEVRDGTLPPRTHNFSNAEWDAHLQANDKRPLLIVLHGLSGGSHEQYVRQAISALTTEQGSDAGFAAVVVNARGCSHSKVTSPVLFNARATWDIRHFVTWVRQQWPERRLFAMGFSLGANILTNYLGEEADACEIEAGIVVGNPWNLDVGNAMMCNSTIGLHVYQRAMGVGLKQLFDKHVDEISKNPNIDLEKVRNSRYLHEFDRHVQCPTYGYPTEAAYYRDASSVNVALNIKVPVLCLGSKDDPICSDTAVPYTQFKCTPYIVLCATSIGGHLGWFELGGTRWSNKVIHGFLTKFVRETNGAERAEIAINGSAAAIDDSTPKPKYHPATRFLELPA